MSSVQCIMISSAELISEFIPGMFTSKLFMNLCMISYKRNQVCSPLHVLPVQDLVKSYRNSPLYHKFMLEFQVCCAIYAVICT